MKIIKGNIFTANTQTIVNTINCVGFMGAGIALEFKLRYPDMYEKYKKLCENRQIDIGKLWIYKAKDKWILNFPTKKHYKFPSKEEYLHKGLEKFVNTYKQKNITSIAFPLLGADKGKLGKEKSLKIMQQYLSNLDIEVFVYEYDPKSNDELFEKFKNYILNQEISIIKIKLNLTEKQIKQIIKIIQENKIYQIIQLLKYKNIGEKTVAKIFEHKEIFNKPFTPSLIS
jgi:O-acetyl-ADP-ribose deacetylase (regulator of RNase III)